MSAPGSPLCMTYEQAVSELYQAPFNDFVAVRKRLTAELKATDKEAAARLGKLPRPPISAWAVNQLWWREQPAFVRLIEAAERVKAGERDAAKDHRQLLSQLRERAAELLRAAGNAATETTLRRVTTTLSAVAASGGFAPDPAGALSADRDPPGFETFAGAASSAPSSEPNGEAEAARRRAELAERQAEDAERERRRAERERLSGALRDAQKLLGEQQREVARLRSDLEAAEQGLEQTRALLAEIEEKLGAL